jgi:hypothetical protein
MEPWQLVVIGVAGWLNRKQQQVVDYLLEENHVLRELVIRLARRIWVGGTRASKGFWPTWVIAIKSPSIIPLIRMFSLTIRMRSYLMLSA